MATVQQSIFISKKEFEADKFCRTLTPGRSGYTYKHVYPELENVMQIARWGNSLAVRLPAELVRALGLKEGDQIDLQPGAGGLTLTRHRRAEEILKSLEMFRGRLLAGARLSRDDANGR